MSSPAAAAFFGQHVSEGAVGGGRGNLCADNPFSHPHCLNLSCLRFYGRFISWSYASFPCSSTPHSLLSSFASQSDQGKWQPQSRQLHCADKPRSLISHSLPPLSLPLSSLFLPLFHHPSLAPLTPLLIDTELCLSGRGRKSLISAL